MAVVILFTGLLLTSCIPNIPNPGGGGENNDPTGNVFSAGWEGPNGGLTKAKVWKNGVGTYLNYSGSNYLASSANDVASKGNNVYVVGWQQGNDFKYVATIWKNGIPTILATDLATGQSSAKAVIIDTTNNDVYVAGYKSSVGVIWKNDTIFYSGPNGSMFYDVLKVGSDIYIAGVSTNTTEVATVWKNGSIL